MPLTFDASSFAFNDAAAVYSQLTAYTVALWVNRAATTSNLTAFSEGNRSNNSPIFVLGTGSTSGKIWLISRNDGGTSGVNINSNTLTVFDGTWHHVAYTQNAAGAWQVYVDGVADATANGSFTPGQTTLTDVCVGAFRTTSTFQTFNGGSVGYPATWLRRLSAQEIVSLAAGMSPALLGPVHYWPLNISEASLPDLASGHAPLALGNTPTTSTSNPRVGISPLRLRT